MNTVNDQAQHFEDSLNAMKKGLLMAKFEVDYHSVDVDSDDFFAAEPKPNELNTSEKLTVKRHWWGFDIICNEKLTQDIIDGIAFGPALATAIASALAAASVVSGGIATALGAAFGAAFELKKAEISVVDNGNGVHFPVTWPQLAAVVAAVPGGPAAVVAAIMIFIHPFRN